jgi:hypothetical protein
MAPYTSHVPNCIAEPNLHHPYPPPCWSVRAEKLTPGVWEGPLQLPSHRSQGRWWGELEEGAFLGKWTHLGRRAPSSNLIFFPKWSWWLCEPWAAILADPGGAIHCPEAQRHLQWPPPFLEKYHPLWGIATLFFTHAITQDQIVTGACPRSHCWLVKGQDQPQVPASQSRGLQRHYVILFSFHPMRLAMLGPLP